MSLHHGTGAVTLDRVGPGDLLEVFGYLDRDPVVNVYLLALALRDGLVQPRDEFWAARRDGELAGLLCLGGQSGAVLPLGDDDDTLRLLGDQAAARLAFLPRRFQVIGPRDAVGAVVARLAARGLMPRVRRAQVYMAVARGSLAPCGRLPELRTARADDYDLVFHSGAALRAEELEEDPRAVDPLAYARRVEEECRDGYTWLWVADGALRFRASVSALTADAVQISGVYTPPALRNLGHATRALAELCTRLFDRAGAACLFVNDFNAPALAVYRRLGFEDRAQWASAFYDAPRP